MPANTHYTKVFEKDKTKEKDGKQIKRIPPLPPQFVRKLLQCKNFRFIYSAALKLYSGLIFSTISAVSLMFAIISSIGLYADGASSIVLLFIVEE